MLQAELLYCLSNNKHICILSSLSARAQWEITWGRRPNSVKIRGETAQKWGEIAPLLLPEKCLGLAQSSGALTENSLWFQRTVEKTHISWWILFRHLPSLTQAAKLNSFNNLILFLTPPSPSSNTSSWLSNLSCRTDNIQWFSPSVCPLLQQRCTEPQFLLPGVPCGTSEVFTAVLYWLGWQDCHSLCGCVPYIYIDY